MSRSPANLTSRAGLDAAGRSNVVLPLLLAFGEDPAWRARHALAYAFAPLARGLDAPAALRAAYAKLMTDPEAEVRAAAALHVAEAVDATRAPDGALDGLAPAVDALTRDVSASVRAALAQRAADLAPALGAAAAADVVLPLLLAAAPRRRGRRAAERGFAARADPRRDRRRRPGGGAAPGGRGARRGREVARPPGRRRADAGRLRAARGGRVRPRDARRLRGLARRPRRGGAHGGRGHAGPARADARRRVDGRRRAAARRGAGAARELPPARDGARGACGARRGARRARRRGRRGPALPVVEAAVADAVPNVRFNAATALGAVGRRVDGAALARVRAGLDALDADEDADVRDFAAAARAAIDAWWAVKQTVARLFSRAESALMSLVDQDQDVGCPARRPRGNGAVEGVPRSESGNRARPVPQGPRAAELAPRGAADPAGGRKGPLRIKKIAERRTIWGGGRRRRNSAARWTMTSLERRLIDDDGARRQRPTRATIARRRDLRRCRDDAPAPPGRAARERGRPALCANVLDEFVRALLPQLDLTSGRAGPRAPRPSGSERPSSRPSCSSCTVTPTSSSLPRVSFPSLPSAHKRAVVDLSRT